MAVRSFSGDSDLAIKDENVFDIRQAVAVGIFIKGWSVRKHRVLYRDDIRGPRHQKHAALSVVPIEDQRFRVLEPGPPMFYLISKNLTNEDEYDEYTKLTEVFSVSSLGIEFGSKDVFLHENRESLVTLMRDKILNPKISDVELASKYDLHSTSGWRFARLRKAECVRGLQRENVRECLSSPFDVRFTYHSPILRRAQLDVLKNMHQPNLLMLCIRQSRVFESGLFFATRLIFSKDVISIKDRATGFPLFTYDEARTKGLFQQQRIRPNFTPSFLERLSRKLHLRQSPAFGLPESITPEDIFQYAYGVFHSPGYRSRYAEFLKIGFPRLPITSSIELFRALSKLGGELVALHLLESPKLEKHITKFVGKELEVEKVTYSDNTV